MKSSNNWSNVRIHPSTRKKLDRIAKSKKLKFGQVVDHALDHLILHDPEFSQKGPSGVEHPLMPTIDEITIGMN